MMRYPTFILVLALVLSMASPAFPQSSNEMLNYNQVQTAINAGTFVQDNGGCNFTGLTVTTVSTFTTCIHTNGACAGAGNSLMPYGNMLACAVTGPMLESLSCGATVANPTTHTCNGLTVTVNNGGFPITYTPNAAVICIYSVRVGGTAIASTGGGDPPGSYTGGATGAISVVISSITGHTCSVGSISIGYYH
jgi:hypothetical protein